MRRKAARCWTRRFWTTLSGVLSQWPQPEKIVLFGSAARGAMNRHSDVDVLVVKEGAHRRHLTGRIYENLYGAGAPVDVVVVTPADVERYKDSHALVIKPALREGKVIYEAA